MWRKLSVTQLSVVISFTKSVCIHPVIYSVAYNVRSLLNLHVAPHLLW